jgi:hypothetical protein
MARLILYALLLAVAIPFSASAAPQCDLRERAVAHLLEKYKESPVALGVTHNGGLVEVLTTADGSTWSIIVTTPQGMSCLVAAGDGWRAVPLPAAAEPGA